ncbi:MAG: hypothetical protein WC943_03100 [Elusimicrobiota bacterium]
MRQDAAFGLCGVLLFLPFIASPDFYSAYASFNKAHPFLMSFLKFSVLATAGEALGLRVRTGSYSQPGFGLLPRAACWGLFGLAIQAAFIVFSAGTPQVLARLGWAGAPEALASPGLSGMKVLASLSVSTAMNLVFAPILMVTHKVTDTHITGNGGSCLCLIKPIPAGRILRELDWDVMWGFVLKKTIPLFWIPAHTITFLLAPEWRALFAALLGIVLGVLLAVASSMAREKAG